jgi:hypothetical protein
MSVTLFNGFLEAARSGAFHYGRDIIVLPSLCKAENVKRSQPEGLPRGQPERVAGFALDGI